MSAEQNAKPGKDGSMSKSSISGSCLNRVVIATEEAVTEAARLIRSGRLVAFPTETVYGLGANACDDHAVAALFAVKGRPQFNPLIVHVASTDSASALVDLGEKGVILASHLWPGPLTLVANRRPDCLVSRVATAELNTLAVRVPDHPVALTLLIAAECPIVAPSANPFGQISPTTAAHVASSLGGAGAIDLILDGGPCRVGVESTVIDISGPCATLLRPGGVTVEAIERLIGPVAVTEVKKSTSCCSLSVFARHYAPHRPLRLDAYEVWPGETLLGFGQVPGATLNLSQRADLEEAAANLFTMLRALDRPDVAVIAVSPVPTFGLGKAINDRLQRAASPSSLLLRRYL